MDLRQRIIYPYYIGINYTISVSYNISINYMISIINKSFV